MGAEWFFAAKIYCLQETKKEAGDDYAGNCTNY